MAATKCPQCHEEIFGPQWDLKLHSADIEGFGVLLFCSTECLELGTQRMVDAGLITPASGGEGG